MDITLVKIHKNSQIPKSIWRIFRSLGSSLTTKQFIKMWMAAGLAREEAAQLWDGNHRTELSHRFGDDETTMRLYRKRSADKRRTKAWGRVGLREGKRRALGGTTVRRFHDWVCAVVRGERSHGEDWERGGAAWVRTQRLSARKAEQRRRAERCARRSRRVWACRGGARLGASGGSQRLQASREWMPEDAGWDHAGRLAVLVALGVARLRGRMRGTGGWRGSRLHSNCV